MTQAVTEKPPEAVTETPPLTARDRKRISRRKFLRKFGAMVGVVGGAGIYGTQVEPFWTELHDVPVNIPKLPSALVGFRIVQLTDLHAGESVPFHYLKEAVAKVAGMSPDVVVVTGDLVTHSMSYVDRVANLLGTIKAPVYVSFGNHDYDPTDGNPGASTILADKQTAALTAQGCIVLRNRAVSLTKNEVRLWFVGLEDIYTPRFSPERAFAGVPRDEPRICLSHNPDGTDRLIPFQPDLILSGHTHGGQVRVPFLGAPILPVENRHRDKGMFPLPYGGSLYVSRGVGFLARIRLNCRPEIPCFVLRSAIA